MAEPMYPLIVPNAEIIAKIEESVQEDHLDKALARLETMEKYRDDARRLSRELGRIDRKKRRFTITDEEYNVGRNLIAEEIIETVEEERRRITPLDIPFVVAAMTHTEATLLITEEIVTDPQACQRFLDFQEQLKKHGFVDLPVCYGECREDWKPYANQQDTEDTIEAIIRETLDDINRLRYKEQELPLISPLFRSADCFDDAKWYDTWKQLVRHSGCVVVVDAVSLFHPTLRMMLSQSSVPGLHENVATFVLSPVTSGADPVNQAIKKELDKHVRSTFFKRYAGDLDELCEFGIGGIPRLRRWICAVLPKVQEYLEEKVPREGNVNLLQQLVGKPSGHDRFILGR